jgi:hypothetical protein
MLVAAARACITAACGFAPVCLPSVLTVSGGDSKLVVADAAGDRGGVLLELGATEAPAAEVVAARARVGPECMEKDIHTQKCDSPGQVCWRLQRETRIHASTVMMSGDGHDTQHLEKMSSPSNHGSKHSEEQVGLMH